MGTHIYARMKAHTHACMREISHTAGSKLHTKERSIEEMTKEKWTLGTYVDLMVIQRSCSSLRVSVKRVSPAFAPAMIPAFETNESVKVDFP